MGWRLFEDFRKLRESGAFPLLWHPRVLLNHVRHERERRALPAVMRSHPTEVEIELTNRCNLACIQCLRSQGLRPYALGDMDLATFERVLAQFPYTLNLSLNGFGEALLHPRVFDAIRLARARLPWAKIVLYSNGMLIDDARAAELVTSGTTEVNVSIDAATPATYERVRRGGELAVVHENIRRLLRARRERGARFPLVGVNFVMLNENEGELVRFCEQAAELGVDFINCITFASYDWGFENRRAARSYLDEMAAARRRIDELGIRCRAFPSTDLSWTDPGKRFGCQFFWGENFRVTFGGEVTLGCCTPFKETYSYGNVLERPFPEIWNGPQFRNNRELAREGRPPAPACVSCDRFAKAFFAERPPAVEGAARRRRT